MGMYCALHAVAPADLEQLLAGRREGLGLRRARGDNLSSVSLEKAWHGLHFLLTGSAWAAEWPLGFLLQGGEPVGDDLGYGPARLLQPEAVSELDAALSGVSDDELWSRFDPDRMEEEQIYPGIWDEPEDDLRDEYLGYFHELKRLVHEAAARGMAVLVVLS
jgi:uncharacterized protein DUF1877